MQFPKSPPTFAELIAAAATDSDDAISELICRYAPRIRDIARRGLGPELRQRIDSRDIVQGVWASFVAGGTPWREFESEDHFIRFMSVIARRHLVNAYDRWIAAARRTALRQVELDAADSHDLAVPEPSPSQQLLADDCLDNVLEGQPANYRRIARLRAAGFKQVEIAAKLKITERTVRRVLRQLEKLWPS